MAAATPNAREIFLAALDVPLAERAAYLEVACGGDAALGQRVEALLRAHDEPGPFLSEAGSPAVGDTAVLPATTGTFDADSGPSDTADHRPTDAPGLVLAGRYKLVEEIGEGGMGAVWMAQQTEPVKRFVAVKLIKAGMDSRAVLARFEAERQALALMDHPNIAKVFDAGTTPDGRPFFVMELVKGVPITQFCDDRRLTPRERLELFVPVCQAIQHAHQKGVIHRDIKPSNVLVALFDDKPVPKVIDFGVAKATGQPLTEKTRHGLRRGRWDAGACRRSRRASTTSTSTRGPTSTRWVCCCTNCSPARPRSRSGVGEGRPVGDLPRDPRAGAAAPLREALDGGGASHALGQSRH